MRYVKSFDSLEELGNSSLETEELYEKAYGADQGSAVSKLAHNSFKNYLTGKPDKGYSQWQKLPPHVQSHVTNRVAKVKKVAPLVLGAAAVGAGIYGVSKFVQKKRKEKQERLEAAKQETIDE